MKPNLDIYVYRRSYTPGEKVEMRLSAFNLSKVQFTAYRMNLGAVVRSSKTLEKFGKTLSALNVKTMPTAATWAIPLGKTYPNQWAERAVKLPPLPPGAYLIQAGSGAVQKRTWLAVTNIALLVKRSRQETLVYATEAGQGRPRAGLPLALADERGPQARGATDAEGVLRVKTAGLHGNEWIYGQANGSPAFALAGQPPPPVPYTVYTVTDRPIYRPGHKVQFKGIIRQRFEEASPGGFRYRPYAGKSATVEIRDATDALISRQDVTTNPFGSFKGELQLAGEPTLGHWQIVVVVGDNRSYGGFDVEAYRKPEMTLAVRFDQPHYLGGATVPVTIDAQYYFGQPVSRASVQYQITFQGGDAEPPYEGQGVTDANGQLHLDIKTQRRTEDRTLSVHATVTDLSRRSQSGDGTTLIAAGLYRLSIETDKSVYKPKEAVLAIVHAVDYDGKPVANAKIHVRLIETRYDRLHRPFHDITLRDVVTDASGKGVARFSSPRPGYLSLEALAFDSGDNKIQTAGNVWVAGEDEYVDYDYPTLGLVAGRQTYRPGEVATVLLNTSLLRTKAVPKTKNSPALPAHPDVWALVTVEGERLGRHQLIHLTRKSTILRVPLAAGDFPSVVVSVAVVQEHQVYEQELRLAVQRAQQKLRVAVTSDKDKYAPGEAATYTITTRDYQGRAVPAEVALGVVDASIYAIQPDNAPDMEAFFYSGQDVRIQTDFSFAAQYSGGAYQTVPSPAPGSAPGGSNIRVRRQFADTAYWNPFMTPMPTARRISRSRCRTT